MKQISDRGRLYGIRLLLLLLLLLRLLLLLHHEQLCTTITTVTDTHQARARCRDE